MYQRSVLFAAIAVFMILSSTSSYAQSLLPDSLSDPKTLEVDIKTVDAPAMYSQDGKSGMASLEHYGHGVIIDPSGIIATNTHIITGAEYIYVTLPNGNTYEATVLYSGKPDISFIKIDTPYLLKTINWGGLSEVQAGSPVIAVADSSLDLPITLDGEVMNLVKGKHSGDVNLLELKLSLKPGDSGGPILDQDGDLLGLIMADEKNDNTISYAISSNKIQREYLKYQATK